MNYSDVINLQLGILLVCEIALLFAMGWSAKLPRPKGLKLRVLRGILVAFWILVLCIGIVVQLKWPWWITDRETPQQGAIAGAPYSSCVLFNFPPGGIQSPSNGNEVGPDEPPGCLADLRVWLKETTPLMIILTGRADQRDLLAQPRGDHYSNEMLAYKRARAIKAWLTDSWPHLAGRIVNLSSGPRYTGEKTENRLLDRDRGVEIRAYWDNAPREGSTRQQSLKPGFAFNKSFLEPSEAIELLALMVALSAYLAGVRLFLGERIDRLREEATTLQKKYPDFTINNIADLEAEIATLKKTGTDPVRQKELEELKKQTVNIDDGFKRRDLLVFPDSLMIGAALLLFMHVFFFWNLTVLLTSFRLLALAAFTLLLFHGREWLRSIPWGK